MDVVASVVKILGLGAMLSMTAAAVANSHHDDPGQRRDIEVELSRSFSFAIVRNLQSPDSTSATRAALSLGRTKDRRALAPLVARFDTSRDVSVRAMSIYGIGLLCDALPCPLDRVTRALRDPASAVRAAGADAAQRAIAARQQHFAELLGPLVTQMRSDVNPIVRARAAVALAAFAPLPLPPTPQAPAAGAAVVRAMSAETNRTVRWHLAWTLGRAYPLAPSPRVIAAGLHDRDELVRMAFIDVAAKRGDPRLAGSIAALRSDRSWRVAEQAREGLRRLAGRLRTQHLTAIPAGFRPPPAHPGDGGRPLERPSALGPVRRPGVADVPPQLALHLTTAASLDGPARGPHPRVRIATTKGPIVVRLYPEWAPLTVANFLNLVDRGYYDGLRWFRIVPNFVAQTGDPHDNGDGDAGYTIPAEENPLEQRSGVISMGLNYTGNAPIRDSAGTQFYLTMSPQFHLNRSFTVFGEIERGFDVLGRLIESDRMIRVEQLPAD